MKLAFGKENFGGKLYFHKAAYLENAAVIILVKGQLLLEKRVQGSFAGQSCFRLGQTLPVFDKIQLDVGHCVCVCVFVSVVDCFGLEIAFFIKAV